MTQLMSAYTTRAYRAEDEEQVLELLRQSLGESEVLQRTPTMWQWKHLASPFGSSPVQVACGPDGQLIGMRAFTRWEFQAGDRRIRAARAVDTATHPGYRRLGIFSTLTEQVLADLKAEGTGFIFNTPNQDVLPGYLKLGWRQIATVRPLIKVLNYPAFAAGMLRRRLGKPSARHQPPAAFFKREAVPASALLERRESLEELIRRDDLLWSRRGGLRTRRSWDYLSWRYGRHPTIPYWTVFVEDGSGGLRGCAVFRANTRYGLKEIVLCELMLAEADEGLCRRLLGDLRARLRADYLITYFPTRAFHHQAVKRWGFRSIPNAGMNFTVKPLGEDMPVDPFQFDNWALSLGDLELF